MNVFDRAIIKKVFIVYKSGIPFKLILMTSKTLRLIPFLSAQTWLADWYADNQSIPQ